MSQNFWAGARKAVDRIQRTIFEPEAGKLVAVSRGFRAVFKEAGVSLVGLKGSKPAAGSISSEKPGLEASWSWARVEGLVTGPPRLSKDRETVVVDHGLLRETFENRSDGIEHMIVVHIRPPTETLKVHVAVNSDLEPCKTGISDRIAFVDDSGRERLQYKGLKVWDAVGQVLPARLAATHSGILISVDDRNATYPVTIDPVLSEPPSWAWSWSETPSEQFGFSMALLGGVGDVDVAIGCPGFDDGEVEDAGAVFIFDYDDQNDEFPEVPSIVLMGPPDDTGGSPIEAQEDGRFGHALAVGVGGILVGAPGYDATPSVGTPTGACYLITFDPNEEEWETAEVVYGTQGGSQFGWSVVVIGDVDGIDEGGNVSEVVVGAPYFDTANSTNAGIAYMYEGEQGLGSPVWSSSGDDEPEGLFGYSLACITYLISGDGIPDVIIGAPGLETSSTYGGKAFVFEGVDPASGPPTLDEVWSGTGEDQPGAQFGFSVAGSFDLNEGGSEILIGAPRFDTNNEDAGRVYVYLNLDESPYFSSEPDWSSSGPDQEGALFGSWVGAGHLGGEDQIIPLDPPPAYMSYPLPELVIGAPGYDDGSNVDVGAIVIYEGAADEPLVYDGEIVTAPQGGMGSARLGSSVLIVNNPAGVGQVFAGAPFGDNYSEVDVGWVLFLPEPLENPGVVQKLFPGVDVVALTLGGAIAGQGDANGDGYADVLVGAPDFDDGDEENVGAAFLFLGSGNGLAMLPAWISIGIEANAHYGSAVAFADLTGDGRSEAIVSHPDYDGSAGENSGLVSYFQAQSDSPEAPYDTWPRWTLQGDAAGRRLGQSLARAGRVNGSGGVPDSLDDVVIGGNNAAFVHFDSPFGGVDWSVTNLSGNYGFSVAGAGDVNGDGFDDIIVGAPDTVNGGVAVGAVYVYLGSNNGPSSNPWIEYGETLSPFRPTRFGQSVAGLGDIDGDSIGDIAIGAPGIPNHPLTWAGRAYIYRGSGSGLPASPDWTTDGAADNDCYGWIVAAAGDVNGDDLSDLVISSPGSVPPAVGTVYLFIGVDGDVPDTVEESSAAASGSGVLTFGRRGLAGVGDVNGDGFDDIMVSQYGFFDDQHGNGRLFLYHGGN